MRELLFYEATVAISPSRATARLLVGARRAVHRVFEPTMARCLRGFAPGLARPENKHVCHAYNLVRPTLRSAGLSYDPRLAMPVTLQPRLIRYRDAPSYCGVGRRVFDRDIRPWLTRIPIGKEGVPVVYAPWPQSLFCSSISF